MSTLPFGTSEIKRIDAIIHSPPCKVYFNIDIPAIKGKIAPKKRKSNRESKAFKLTPETFAIVSEAFERLKK